MNQRKTLIFICVLFFVCGILFITVGIVTANQSKGLKRRCTEETIGTVVDLICEQDINRDTDSDSTTYTYFPVIEYQAGDRTVSQKSNSGQYPAKYQVGDQVTICYNPDNVEEYIIKGDLTPKFLGLISLVLGSIAVAVGLISFVRIRRIN